MDQTTSPLVSILVLNYNGKKFLSDCFNSLLNSTYFNQEIIMIDNKSTDDSVDYVTKNYPQVKVFNNGVNGGFSLAYNNGFKIAKGKYFVILNNDVTVDPKWLEPMVVEAEIDPLIGALQPKLLSMIDKTKFEYAGASGGYLDKYGYPFARGRIFDIVEEDKSQYDDIVRVFWTTGAAMFLRASVLEQSGDLDVDFVHHMEEIDLCYRLNLAGYILKVVPSSIVYHYGGGIISYESYQKMYWNHRNSVFMLLKNLETSNLYRIILTRMFLDELTIFSSLLKGEFRRIRAIYSGYYWLFTHRKMIREKRAIVQKQRKVSDREIFKLMYPRSIAFRYFFFQERAYSKLKDIYSS